MKRAKHIQDELQELGADVLTTLPLSNPFSVPAGYFEQLNAEVKLIISDLEMPEPEVSWKKEMPFSAPGPDYFAQLGNAVMSKIEADSAPSWSRDMPYTVPQGYFEQFPQKVLAKAKNRNHVVLPERKRVPLFRTVRLAASIALILFMGLGVIHIHNQHDLQASQAASQSDIRSYVEANLDDFDTDIIINGLATSGEAGNNGKLDINLSQEEIKAYLNETGWN